MHLSNETQIGIVQLLKTGECGCAHWVLSSGHELLDYLLRTREERYTSSARRRTVTLGRHTHLQYSLSSKRGAG